MGCKEICEKILTYDTVKIVKIKDWKLGLIHYGVILLIIFYVVGYAIVWEKGYQTESTIVGYTTLKVKGSGFTYKNGSYEIYDAYDVVHPPLEPSALFVSTIQHVTPFQTRAVCEENDSGAKCTTDSDCTPGTPTKNGVTEGSCGPNGFCEVYAWCPLENDADPVDEDVIKNVDQFTVFTRCSISFPLFGVTRDNIGDSLELGYNLFAIGDMVNQTGYTWESITKTGAVIAVGINWDCDLDKDLSLCQPVFNFSRLDDPNNSFSSGFNYRMTDSYYLPYMVDNDVTYQEYRDLTKLYGVRFVYLLSGVGGKFDIVPLVDNLASGLALLAIATVVADICALYILPGKKVYQSTKYEPISAEEQLAKGTEEQLLLTKA
eukprot:TRINITY_DN497_c2_g5_i1.p1 TRINITY_DN497_c2_g5~~TRINITY_DN497_c2_g5_i1.p1  ORF type:complete len:376 (+),score=163.02 TRINITY_DN497_c2_g5_i1:113-1240(+)